MSKNVRWNPGKDPIPIINDAAQRGVGLAAEHVLGEARKIVPHDEGTLERSGRAATRITGNRRTRLQSYFDTDYADRSVTSDLQLSAQEGSQGQVPRDPLNKNKGTIREIVAAAIRKQL